ncbi:thiol-disulfide oxidoreductase DCC family protein [Kurthia huakuii]|uniref:thiol-disulfide oxidoreductase DCC family protein n=1 Tax=Kurthia huakuii TaxID=1421019 RepID=UPI0004974970|nr:DCC1-like thiol-disulfide oxidoreductase family protein [Kurthia huakuii]MBM7698195.1 putative DCC family thiol-disulfide oxidoreductase YuxK [Kurthia huakuii]
MGKPILFYDGDCGFCSAAVQFILDHEANECFLFTPLQGELAARELPTKLVKDLNTFVVKHDHVLYTKAQAVFFVARYLNKPYCYMHFGRYVPIALSNRIYDIVAKNRDSLSKVSKMCKIPSEQERKRFIH